MVKKYSVENKHIFKAKENSNKNYNIDIVKVIYNYKTETRKIIIESFNHTVGYEKYEREYSYDYKDYWLGNGFVEVFNK